MRKTKKRPAERPDWEKVLALQIRAARLPEPQRGYRFAPGRKFAFDFAWETQRLAVEVEGGVWGKKCKACGVWTTGGRHASGAGFEKDCEKYAIGFAYGWRILRLTPKMVKDGTGLGYIELGLKM